MRRFLLFSMMLFFAGSAFAQRTLTGKVTDENAHPISGASVQVLNSKAGTVTNDYGNFSLILPQNAKTLVISVIGRATREVNIGSQTHIDIVMSQVAEQLEEVVVTGVGTATSRKKLGIAVESVSAKDLPKVPQASIDQALVGKIAGAQITSSSGQPGQQAAILLRGINTLGSTQPMILVDGVQINSGNNLNGSGSNLSSRLSDLDLSTVERVEIVQGAAAATIYGAQGANGVIQIFTKKGTRNGRLNVNLSSRYSIDKVLKGNFDYAKYHYFETDSEGYILSNTNQRLAPNSKTGIYPLPKAPASLVNAVNDKPFIEPTYNHIDYLFRTANTWNHSVGLNGGFDRMDFSLILSRLNQQSVFTGDYTRNNISLNIGAQLFKNFNIRSITQLVSSDNSTGGITGQNNIYSPLGVGLNTRQFVDLRTKDSIGNYIVNPVAGDNSVNPYYTKQFREFLADNTRLLQNINLNYKPFSFLELDYKLGIDNYRYDYTNFTAYQLNTLTPSQGISPINGNLTYDKDNQTLKNSLLTLFLRTNFKEDFGINLPVSTTTQVAYDYRKDFYNNIYVSGTGFAPFPPYTINGTSQSAFESEVETVTFGYLVNQKITWGNLLGISGTLRVDYSSAFGSGSEPFVFPSGDAYLNISEFLKSNYIRDWKIRAAYGKAGKQPGAYDRFITLNSGNIGSGGYLSTKSIANNPLLNVEVSSELEAGTDLTLKLGAGSSLQNVRLSATYWDKESKDVIRGIDVAPSSGALGLLTNAISLASNGVQVSVDADIINAPKLNWNFGLRFGKSQSMVVSIANEKDITLGGSGSGQFVLREGESIGAFFGIKPLHDINQTTSKGVRYIPLNNVNDYELVNGMVVNKVNKQVQFTSEQEAIGDPNPDFNITFLNNISINKNLNISAQLDWVYGNQIYNQTRQWMYRDGIHSDWDQPVTINGETAAFTNYYVSLYNTSRTHSFFVEDGSFLRLRELSIAYQLKDLLSNKFNFIQNAEISLSGRNLFTITKYKGLDPESSASLNNPLRRGLDLYNFPNFRTFQLGLNLGF